MAKATKTGGRGVTALATYDEELAKLAEEATTQEANTGGGQFFSIRGGTLALGGAPIPGNEMAVVVVDAILVNAHYEGDYDPDQPKTPTCYAFGRDEKSIAPHDEAEDKKSEGCADCELNQFGSAEKGRGKGCKNGRRLALLAAGELDAKTGEFSACDVDELRKGQVAFLNLPPTSINSYGAYVKKVFSTLKRPPQGVVTKVSVVPDPKTQLKVVFEVIDTLEGEALQAVLERNREVRDTIAFPFPKVEAPARPAARGSARPTRAARGRY